MYRTLEKINPGSDLRLMCKACLISCFPKLLQKKVSRQTQTTDSSCVRRTLDNKVFAEVKRCVADRCEYDGAIQRNVRLLAQEIALGTLESTIVANSMEAGFGVWLTTMAVNEHRLQDRGVGSHVGESAV